MTYSPIYNKTNIFSSQVSTNKKIILNKNIQTIESKKEYQTYTKTQYIQKRIIDVLLSSMLLLLSFPIIFYALYRIKKESPGPIFFKQTRIGLNGKPFTCYKFRSMHVNSEFNPYTQQNDYRIFPFGNIMRKMRIDELPQLLNVFKGEMHLIGPRAEWDILVKKYETIIPDYHDRHLVSPGITGLAQVCYHYGSNIKDTKNKLKYDRLYIESWSVELELKIILKTIAVVLGKKGI